MFKDGMAIRLVGVRTDNLVDKKEQQLSLFSNLENEKQDKIDVTLDKLKEKYGYDLIKKGAELNTEKIIKIIRKEWKGGCYYRKVYKFANSTYCYSNYSTWRIVLF